MHDVSCPYSRFENFTGNASSSCGRHRKLAAIVPCPLRLAGDCGSTSFRLLLLLRSAQGAAPEDEPRVQGAARGVLVASSLLFLRLAHGGGEILPTSSARGGGQSWGIGTGATARGQNAELKWTWRLGRYVPVL